MRRAPGQSNSIVADTIMHTIELGVTITDAALDDDVTVVFCDLLVDGPDRCPQCGSLGDTGTRSCGR